MDISNWSHKIEEWRTIPLLPIRISTHGRLEKYRQHSFGVTKKMIEPIDSGSIINYVFNHNATPYSFSGAKMVADAFIGPPAAGTVLNKSKNYRDITIWNMERRWKTQSTQSDVPREVAYFILKIMKEETHLYDFYFNKDIEKLKQEFRLSEENLDEVLNTSLKDISNYDTIFDKLTTYSPFVEQYYWVLTAYLTGKGFPRPPIKVRSNSPWNAIQSCLQLVEKDFRKKRVEWSDEVRNRFPELWSRIIT